MGGAKLVVGCFSSSSSLLGCYGRWERESCWVAVAIGKERENLKGEREKKIIDIHSYGNRVYLHDYCNKCVYIHIFTPTDVGSFGEKLCKFCTILTLSTLGTSADALNNYYVINIVLKM